MKDYETELWNRYAKKVKKEKFKEWLWFPALLATLAGIIGAFGKFPFLKGFEPLCIIVSLISGFLLFYILIESQAIEEEVREELEKEGIEPKE